MPKYHLTDGYTFAGYKPYQRVEGAPFSGNRIIMLKRVLKKRPAPSVAMRIVHITIEKYRPFVIYRVETSSSTCSLNGAEHGVSVPVW